MLVAKLPAETWPFSGTRLGMWAICICACETPGTTTDEMTGSSGSPPEEDDDPEFEVWDLSGPRDSHGCHSQRTFAG